MADRVYPLPNPGGEDGRFNFGLVYDVAGLLHEAGYPVVTGVDMVELRQVLHGFLYQRPEET
ncbi:MAG: hypothetical protein M3N43_01730 [Actinomycetota bacterium]|nr:hypothetical protein [Actinomycetota bacterium]